MSQGYQSEFLTYVKRTGNLPPSPARTTSRYGRPLGGSKYDRRAGFVEFAPAARKFPDNSPLNEDGTWKVNSRDTPPSKAEESDVKAPAAQQQQQQPPTPTSSPAEKTEGQLAFGGAGFTSNSFYRKDSSKMKDRDMDDGQSSASDTAGLAVGEVVDAERRRRRLSPVSVLSVEDKSARGKANSPIVAAALGNQREAQGNDTPRNGNSESADGSHQGATVAQQSRDLLVKNNDKKADDKFNPSLPACRPKRNIIPKNMKETGLSWREENDLKKALYASLQETKRPGEEYSENGSTPSSEKSDRKRESRTYNSKSWSNSEMDESSQESSKSYLSTETNNSETKLASMLKVRAQRKFAVGSRPGSPGSTPVKNKNAPRKFFTTKKAKTEDFLTFLCLRGSHMLPPHLDFSKCDDSDDCFQSSSCPNTPKSSRPSTPALAGIAARDLTPRGGRGAQTSRSTTPDKDICLEDNELGVKPLPNDPQSPMNSPAKKLNNKPVANAVSPTKLPFPSKRKSTSDEQSSPSEKKTKVHEKEKEKSSTSPSKKKDKDRIKKKKKNQEGTIEGKVKKKKKKRKEEAKMLRRKLVLRARNTAVKASKRKLKMAEKALNEKGENGERMESITSILEGLTSKRGVGRPRKVDLADAEKQKDNKKDTQEKEKSKVDKKHEKAEQPSVPLSRTRSPETRSTRSNPRPESPSISQPTKTPAKDSETSPSTTDQTPPKSSSKKEKRNSSRKKKKVPTATLR